MIDCLISRNPLKICKNIENIENETEYNDEKKQQKINSILSEIKISMLDFFLHWEIIFKLTEKKQHQILDKVLSKYSKETKSVRKSEDHFNELSKYSKSPP